MKRIKLVHVISSLKIGGAESLLVDLIRLMPSHRYDHHVIYFHDGPNRTRLTHMGIPTYHVSGGFCLYDPIFWLRLYRLLKILQPDIIHGSLWAANFAVRLIGKMILHIPTVCVLHWSLEQDGRIRNMLDYGTLDWADRVVAIADGVASSLADAAWVSHKNIQVIYNGIDSQYVHQLVTMQAVTRDSLGIAPEALVFGTVGRFIYQKNYHHLINVFANVYQHYPHIRLLLVGLGPLEQDLRKQVAQLGITSAVIFVIGQPAYGYYKLMDCFVLPSLQEGLSIALLEAMSCGIPCVTTGVQHQVIHHNQNGILVLPHDAAELCRQLARMIVEEPLRKQLGKAGQARVIEAFQLADTARTYERLFEDMFAT